MADSRHLEKSKNRHIVFSLTDFDQILHSNAAQPTWAVRPLKISNFKNPRWRQPPSWKNEKKSSYIGAVYRFRPNLHRNAVRHFWAVWPLKISHFKIPRWRKIAISRLRCDRFRPNLARRWSSTILSSPTVKSFKNMKIHDIGVRHLQKSKYRHISATIEPVATKSGTLTQFDRLDHSVSKIGPQ